jgi:hypothetical protein
MSIILPALVAAFGALCVWLTVRVVNRRERWAKWTLAIIVGVPAMYVAGFGPASWACDKLPLPIDEEVCALYRPLSRLAVKREGPAGHTLWWWSTCFHKGGRWTPWQFYVRHSEFLHSMAVGG